MQVQKVRVAGGVELRPSRLNFAGWCLWCTRRFCEDAMCVARHAGSSWEVCSRCEGAEYVDVHGVMERCDCVGGLSESVGGELAEVLEFPAVDAEPGACY